MILISEKRQNSALGQICYHYGHDEDLETIKRFSAKHSGISVIDLLFYLLVYKTEVIDSKNKWLQ